MVEFLLERVENIKRKGENAGYQHFLLLQHFLKGRYSKEVFGKQLNGFELDIQLRQTSFQRMFASYL